MRDKGDRYGPMEWAQLMNIDKSDYHYFGASNT